MDVAASLALIVAGLLSAACSAFGLIAFLGLGFPSTLTEALLEIGLMGGLPLFLVGLLSLRLAALLLLLQFAVQWLSSSLINGSFQPVNPFGAWDYVATITAASLVGIVSIAISPRDLKSRGPRLGDVFKHVEDSFGRQ